MEHDINKITDLFFECFKDDPGVLAQLYDVERSPQLFKAMSKGEAEAFMKAGLVSVIGEYDGLMIAFSSEKQNSPEFINILQESSKYILEEATNEEINLMQNKMLKAAEISKPDWYKKYSENVYIIQVIAVAQKMRGKGVFRKLMTPVIEKCDAEKIPIALQTHNADNLKKYEHFGFKIMESVYSEELNLTCYNLLRYPD